MIFFILAEDKTYSWYFILAEGKKELDNLKTAFKTVLTQILLASIKPDKQNPRQVLKTKYLFIENYSMFVLFLPPAEMVNLRNLEFKSRVLMLSMLFPLERQIDLSS